VEWIAFFEEFKNPVILKVAYVYLSQPTFVQQLLKFLRSSTRASALKIKNVHSRVKILGRPITWYGTFSGSKLFTDSYAWRSTLTTRSKKVKNSWNFQIFSIRFLRWPVLDRTDLHRYIICTFLESRSNLQFEKVPYHFVGQPISLL
jgi:hypothetical protein